RAQAGWVHRVLPAYRVTGQHGPVQRSYQIHSAVIKDKNSGSFGPQRASNQDSGGGLSRKAQSIRPFHQIKRPSVVSNRVCVVESLTGVLIYASAVVKQRNREGIRRSRLRSDASFGSRLGYVNPANLE